MYNDTLNAYLSSECGFEDCPIGFSFHWSAPQDPFLLSFCFENMTCSISHQTACFPPRYTSIIFENRALHTEEVHAPQAVCDFPPFCLKRSKQVVCTWQFGKRAELWVKKMYLSNLTTTLPNHCVRGGTRLEKWTLWYFVQKFLHFWENFEKRQEPVKPKNLRNEVIQCISWSDNRTRVECIANYGFPYFIIVFRRYC